VQRLGIQVFRDFQRIDAQGTWAPLAGEGRDQHAGRGGIACVLPAAGLHTHMKRALEVGASRADIFDVLHLVAVQGIARVGQATDILGEFVDLDGMPAIDEKLRARIDRLGAAHALALRGVARLDPGYAEVLLDFVEQGGPGTGLSPAERSLVQLALHACFTAFDPDAIRRIVPTALSQGLAPAELLQAIQLGAHLAVHGTALGVNVYRQLAGAGSPAD